MWVRLKKSTTVENKKWPIGRCLNVSTPKARELVDEGFADYYDGPRPPLKMKTDFFKPK